ncbi:hypothetical protein JW835_01575 [bacterium]|nr:hypothetical protein [bacterium]
MIVPMQKLTLLISAQSRAGALKTLRKLGLLHIKHIQTPQDEEIDLLNQQINAAEKVCVLLESHRTETKQKHTKKNAGKIVEQILDLQQTLTSLKMDRQEKNEIAGWFETWGDVSPDTVKTLREHGVYIRFYVGDSSGMKKISADKNIQVVKETGSAVYFTFFSESEDEKLDFKEEALPEVEPRMLWKEIRQLNREIHQLSEQLASLAAYHDAVQKYIQILRQKLEMSHVFHGMGESEGFVYLQGFCPQEKIRKIKDTADQEGWGYIFQDPEDPKEVPTLLRNSKVPRMIEPLFKFMGILPGYHELDVSYVFLLFFSIFYAIIIGDAGYGFVFLFLTAFFRSKHRHASVEPFALFYVLSITTIIWGMITGTWFGSRAIAEWPALNKIIIEPMFSFNESREATRFMMWFSFYLGLIQLIVAHFLAFIKKKPSLKAIAECGWILICVGMFFVVDLLVLGNPMPGFAMVLMIVGLVIVGLFTNFQKNPLKMLGSFIGSILNSIQSVISAFSDIVSYIRLFAVGLAGVTVAASFNEMAGGIFAPIVLVLGHGLNIVLGMMSVMVHGVRLNMLEFSGHLGQEWTGYAYQPFEEKDIE